ncbi:MAG: hypothetical protein R2771_02425 [Saprospiraceae bacterium]
MMRDQVLFSWMPRHFSLFPVEYVFEIYDFIEGMNDIDLVSNYEPLVKIETNGLSYFYNEADGQLINNHRYKAIVKVIDKNNNLRFYNEGYSESIEFTLMTKICKKRDRPYVHILNQQ